MPTLGSGPLADDMVVVSLEVTTDTNRSLIVLRAESKPKAKSELRAYLEPNIQPDARIESAGTRGYPDLFGVLPSELVPLVVYLVSNRGLSTLLDDRCCSDGCVQEKAKGEGDVTAWSRRPFQCCMRYAGPRAGGDYGNRRSCKQPCSMSVHGSHYLPYTINNQQPQSV